MVIKYKHVVNQMRMLIAFLIGLVLMASCHINPNQIRVLDGDTFEADGKGIRIAMIDAPEKDQALGREATLFLDSLLSLGQPKIRVIDKDHYGRKIGVVSIMIGSNSIDVGYELIKAGLAEYLNEFHTNESYCNIQQEAIMNSRGVWSLSDRISPREFRRRNK